MQLGDTIAAIATTTGGIRAIVRTSGPHAIDALERLSGTRSSGKVQISIDDLPAVEICVLLFHAPRSATGEDVVEYHMTGNTYLVGKFMENLLLIGLRQAEPGEFTARALFTGKLDLTAAEGVAATIAATQRQQLDASRQLLKGELSARIVPQIDALAQALALTEVGIDFTEEDVVFLSQEDAKNRVSLIRRSLHELMVQSPRFELVGREASVVLVGRPNAGKSTLFNALVGHERAVVSPISGTTRDAIEALAELPCGRVRLIDVAGLDEGLQSDNTHVDRQMRERAREAVSRADVVVLVVSVEDEGDALELDRKADIVVRSKHDLRPGLGSFENAGERELFVSAQDETGVILLKAALDEICFGAAAGRSASAVSLNARHRSELTACIDALDRSITALDQGAEFFAFELREALDCLGRIVGTVSADDVLGRVFSSFCIGK